MLTRMIPDRPTDRPPTKRDARAVERVKDLWKAFCREQRCRFDIDAKAAECLAESLRRRQFQVFTKLRGVRSSRPALLALRQAMKREPAQVLSLWYADGDFSRIEVRWAGSLLGTIHPKHAPWLVPLSETGELELRAEEVTGGTEEALSVGLNIAVTRIGRALFAHRQAGGGHPRTAKAA